MITWIDFMAYFDDYSAVQIHNQTHRRLLPMIQLVHQLVAMEIELDLIWNNKNKIGLNRWSLDYDANKNKKINALNTEFQNYIWTWFVEDMKQKKKIYWDTLWENSYSVWFVTQISIKLMVIFLSCIWLTRLKLDLLTDYIIADSQQHWQ